MSGARAKAVAILADAIDAQTEEIERLRGVQSRLAAAFDAQVGWSECDSCQRDVAITYPGGGEGTSVPEGSFCAACGGGDEDMLVYRDEVES